jgi:hypothetical protein
MASNARAILIAFFTITAVQVQYEGHLLLAILLRFTFFEGAFGLLSCSGEERGSPGSVRGLISDISAS